MTATDSEFAAFRAGDDVAETYHWEDIADVTIDLSGRTFLAQIRPSQNSASAWDFTVTTDLVAGNVTLSMPGAITATIPLGRFYWALRDTTTSTGLGRVVIAGRVSVGMGLMP